MEKEGPQPAESEETSIYSPAIPREKWQRKRTQVKIRVRPHGHQEPDPLLGQHRADPWPWGDAAGGVCSSLPGGCREGLAAWRGRVLSPGFPWVPAAVAEQAAEPPVSLQNVTANHRASDVIVCEGKAQVLSGRFMYGPLDVVTLTGEKVSGPHRTGWGCPAGDTGLVSPVAGEGMW